MNHQHLGKNERIKGNSFDVKRKDTSVFLLLNGEGFGAPWRFWDDVCAALRTQLRLMSEHHCDYVFTSDMSRRVMFQVAGGTIQWHQDGKLWFSLAHADMSKLWAYLVAKTREAEEQEKAPAIAEDYGVCIASGAPFGLSNRPDIQAEAIQHARNDRTLRQVFPSIRSKEIHGVPSLMHGKASPIDRARRLSHSEKKLLLKELN